MSNPLDPIMAWHGVALDSMRITSRVLEKEIGLAIAPKHIFYGQPTSECLERVEEAKAQVADLAVLALVATFERGVRDFLGALPRNSTPGGNPVDEAVRKELLGDLEYWNLSDRILRVFGNQVPATVIGQVRQIIEYRNWIAHGRSESKPPSARVVPQFAYRTLSEFLRLSGIV
jgi:hypothetical protein